MRRILFAAAAVALPLLSSALPAMAADPAGSLTIMEPYGAGSITDRVITALGPALEARTGKRLTVEHSGPGTLNQLAHAAADGGTVAIVGLLPVELAETRSNPGVKISSATPIAKLTGPGSVVLVVADGSPIKSWADFAAAAKAKRLALASPGRDTAPGVAIAMMERMLGVRFRDVIAQQRFELLVALQAKKADAAFLETLTLADSPSAAVRPIATFGGQHNPALAQVPTFRELSGAPDNGHNAITSAIGVFGPPGMKPEVVTRLAADFAAAGKAAKESGAVAASRLPIEVGDTTLLRETMARDERVIRDAVTKRR